MRKVVLAWVALVMLVGITIFYLTSTPSVQKAVKSQVQIGRQNVEIEINNVRTENGVPVVTSSEYLAQTAMQRAEDMCKKNNWSHDGFLDTMREAPPSEKMGENLAYASYGTPLREIIQGWKDSPGHFRNMIDPVYTEQAIAIKDCDGYQGLIKATIYVNHFRMPK